MIFLIIQMHHMKKTQLEKFKKMFERKRALILYNDKILREDFHVNLDDRYDDLDQASSDVEQSLRMRLRDRERIYLKKLEEALMRIDEGTYGLCDECEEPIEIKRLEARPTATLCLACKENEERAETLGAVVRAGRIVHEQAEI